MQYNTVQCCKRAPMDNVTELRLGINTDCSSLIPKPHPHPRKKGLLFTVWACDFPSHRLPYSRDVKNLYYCYPVCAVFLINDGSQLLSLIACFAIPFSSYVVCQKPSASSEEAFRIFGRSHPIHRRSLPICGRSLLICGRGRAANAVRKNVSKERRHF